MFEDNDVADSITLSGLDQLCVELSALKGKIDELKNEKTALEQSYSELSEQIIAHLTAHKKDKYDTPVGSFGISRRFTYKTPKTPEEREAFFGYLKSQGTFDDLITVNSQTLNAYAKRELETAQEEGRSDFEIPGLGEPTLFERITIRKNK